MATRGALAALALASAATLTGGCGPKPVETAAPRRYRVDVQVRPDSPARQMVHSEFTATVRRTDGLPLQDPRVTLDLSMPSMTMPRNQVPLVPGPPGEFRGRGIFTMAGEWRIAASVAEAAGEPEAHAFTRTVR